MVNPALQTNKVKTFLMLDAEQMHHQDLDETEDIHIELIDFDKFGDMIRKQLVQTQLFTVHGYYLAKSYLTDTSGSSIISKK